jgi:large conductance mechanosensitive channel
MREVKHQLADFKKFILRGNVVDLAVAVVIGAAFTNIVNTLVSSLITPLIAAIGGKPDFSNLVFTINGSKFTYGLFINALISFVIVAAVIFFLVVQPINKFLARVKPSDEIDKPAERGCPACLSPIPAAATRCKFCTTRFDKAGGSVIKG